MYQVLDLEARTVVAVNVDATQAHDLALHLPATFGVADEPTARRIQAAWAGVGADDPAPSRYASSR